MAQTLSDLRNRVRTMIRDTDGRNASRDLAEIDDAIAEAYLVLASRIPSPSLYTASAFTIAANADTFTLPTSGLLEYTGDVRIRLRSDGRFLRRRTLEEIDRFRSGDISTVGTTRPELFALWMEADQEVQGRCWPRSRDAELCDLFAALSAQDLRENIEAASTIHFSRFGTVALVLHAAATIVTGLTDADLEERRLNRDVVPLWLKDADRTLVREEGRRHDVEAVGRMMKLVS